LNLYIPRHFEAPDRASVARLIHDYPFATLVSAAGGDLHVTHLPLVHVADSEPNGSVLGHFARGNPHWRHLAGAATTAIFRGPHHYVSPSWYVDPQGSVPTWNYAVVHARGDAEPIESRGETEGVLQLMIGRFESSMPQPWSLSLTEARLSTMLDAIVAFRIRIRHLDAKFKLSQNRDSVDRRRVAAALGSAGTDDAAAMAEWMRRYGE
jgi:transcriptional regulator